MTTLTRATRSSENSCVQLPWCLRAMQSCMASMDLYVSACCLRSQRARRRRLASLRASIRTAMATTRFQFALFLIRRQTSGAALPRISNQLRDSPVRQPHPTKGPDAATSSAATSATTTTSASSSLAASACSNTADSSTTSTSGASAISSAHPNTPQATKATASFDDAEDPSGYAGMGMGEDGM